VAWPPPGYVPYQVVFPRWSFSHTWADFSQATVTMSSGGQGIGVALLPVHDGYGENTLVWTPSLSSGGPPTTDKAYDVSVKGVVIGGVPRDFGYRVIVFNPGSSAATSAGVEETLLGDPPAAAGTVDSPRGLDFSESGIMPCHRNRPPTTRRCVWRRPM